MNHISLFTGIGGIDLAAEWAGFETVLMVEQDKFCRQVLKKHWPDVPIVEDIFDVTGETIEEAIANSNRHGKVGDKSTDGQGGRLEPYSEEAVADPQRTTKPQETGKRQEHQPNKGNPLGNEYCAGSRATTERGNHSNQPIALVTGGFPCQPFSVAGKRRGKEDDRYLWPEMLRVIKEVRPRWVVAENVAGLLRMGFDDCVSDLEGEGFTTESFIIPACAVNAPHRRDRIFIVAWNTEGNGSNKIGRIQERQNPITRGICQDVADTDTEGLQGHRGLRERRGEWLTWTGSAAFKGIWELEPPICRVASGISQRVDRLKSLGNAVVPAQIYPILNAIADIERVML